MKSIPIKQTSIFQWLTVSFFLLMLTLLYQQLDLHKASAAYQAGRLIDNSVFLDAGSMSAPQIQSFLVGKNSGLSNMSFLVDCDLAGQQAKQIYASLGAPCGKDASAAAIIYYASHVYGINPRVIISTMQKEQSVITAPNPTSWQINQAMGYACPTSGSCSSSSSFFYQIDNGTWVMRFHYERARGNNNWWYASSSWTCGTGKPSYYIPNLYPGQNVNFVDPYSGIQYATVYIHNAATSAFYCYTPHVFNNHTNSPHPNEPKGSSRCYSSHPVAGDRGRCYTGSYNFVYWFENWFGPTTRELVTSDGNAIYFVENGQKRAIPDGPTFSSYSFKWSDIVTISAGELAQIPNGSVMPYKNL